MVIFRGTCKGGRLLVVVFNSLVKHGVSRHNSSLINLILEIRLKHMPRKILRRYLPHHTHIRANPRLKFLAPLMKDPNLFHLNRYSVSMAFLVGIFFAFLPLPGQMLLAGLFAFWVRCNLPIAVVLVWITNPLTIPPILFMNYKLGVWILDTPSVIYDDVMFWQWLNAEIGRIWRPLFLGSLIVSSLFSVISYFVIRYLWIVYVSLKWRRRGERRARRRHY